MLQAQKFTSVADEDDDELEEESLLETPLDKVEPYSMFKHAILSRFFITGANSVYANPLQAFSKNSPLSTRMSQRTSTPKKSKWLKPPFTKPTKSRRLLLRQRLQRKSPHNKPSLMVEPLQSDHSNVFLYEAVPQLDTTCS
jgi:hypothetical protein